MVSRRSFCCIGTIPAVLSAARSGGLEQTMTAALLGGVHNVADYGAGLVADSAASATANTNTFIAACAALEAAKGGTLYIPPGTYYVGKQDFAGRTELGYAYEGYDVIDLRHCTEPVYIMAMGVRLVMVFGLRFGAFDPVTGLASATKTDDFSATPGNFINLENSGSVVVQGPLELDGDIDNQTIGGEYGNTGIQLQFHGIRSINNTSFSARDVYVHHVGTDGFITQYQSDVDTPHPVYLENCRSLYNGRQGWSITGGNMFTAVNCDFSYTGKNSAVVNSDPCAGIDIENQSNGIRNVNLINVRCYNNDGAGILVAGGVKGVYCYNCDFIGTTSFAFWGGGTHWRLENCTIVGGVTSFPGVTYTFSGIEGRTYCVNTLFSTNPADSPSGACTTTADFTSGSLAFYENCTFRSRAPASEPDMGDFDPEEIPTFSNCMFDMINGQSSQDNIKGNFIGRNVISHNGTFYSNGSTNFNNRGTFVVNGIAYGRGEVINGISQTLNAHASGTTFTNLGGVALVTFTLPARIVAGMTYTFIVQNGDGIKVTAGTGGIIRIAAGVTLEAGSVQSTAAGSVLTLLALSATEWVATYESGVWA